MRFSTPPLCAFILTITACMSFAQCPDQLFESASKTYGVNPNLIRAIATFETSCDQSKTGRNHEIGMMQILPTTARSFGWNSKRLKEDTRYNIECGTAFLSILIQHAKNKWRNSHIDEKIDYIIGAYNAGDKIIYGHHLPNSTRNIYIPAVKRIFNNLGDGPVEMQAVSISIEPWISPWVFTALSFRQNHPLSLNLTVKNIGADAADSAKVIFTFPKSEWNIAKNTQPTNVTIHEEIYEWVVYSRHGAVAPNDSVTTNVIAVPLSIKPSFKMRAVLERSGRQISYPHKTASEFLDAEGFPAIEKTIMVKPDSR